MTNFCKDVEKLTLLSEILEGVAAFQGCSILYELCIVCLWMAHLHEEQCYSWMLQAFKKCQVFVFQKSTFCCIQIIIFIIIIQIIYNYPPKGR